MKIFPVDTSDEAIPLDPLSTLTMTYTNDGFKELVDDIRKNGQLVPIVLRDGKILDGRHRYKACMELGKEVRCTEVGLIDNKEALDIVISNAINKATGTDASKVEAYLMCKAKGVKQKDMPDIFKRLNSNYVRKIAFIEKENPEYLQILLRQNKVRLLNMEFNKVEDYGTIHGIWRTLKGNKRATEKVIEIDSKDDTTTSYDTCIDDIIPNTVAQEEYWRLYDMIVNGSIPHLDSVLGRRLAMLVNNMYKSDHEIN